MEQDSADEFARFYQASKDSCLRAVLATAGDRQLAEDLVAEGFVRALIAWRTVRQHPAPGAWVVRTALNTRISWWRRHGRDVPLAGYDAPAPPGPEPVMDSALAAALRRLPLRQREVIALRVFLDLDTQTTATALGIATGTVGAYLSHAVAALRGPDGVVTVTLHELRNASALQHVLAKHDVPAIVHIGDTICGQSYGIGLPHLSRVVTFPRGYPIVIHIRPAAMPRRSELLFSITRSSGIVRYVGMGLIRVGDPVTCQHPPRI